MVPRAVQAAAAVAALGVPESKGNILAPTYKSWQNNGQQYYTDGPNQGYKTPITYYVHSFTGSGAPKWAQCPARTHNRSGQIPRSFLHPVADSEVAPLVDIVSPVI